MTVARIPFNPEEAGVLRQLAGWMLFISLIHFLAALLTLGAGCFGFFMGGTMATLSPKALVVGIVFLAVGVGTALIFTFQGVLLLQGRGSFSAVVETDDADQAHLMDGLRKLKLFFGVEIAFLALGLIGTVLRLGLSIAGVI